MGTPDGGYAKGRNPQQPEISTGHVAGCAAEKAPLTLHELATLAARVAAHMPYATMRGRDSEQAYFDAKALRDALDLIDPEIVRKNMLAPGQPRPHWADDKGCPQ